MDLSTLNEQQLKAVKHTKGALTVLASAGSGKTRTTITKIAYLIKECKVAPRHIWAMTFTKKATEEMQKRLVKLVGRVDANSVNLGTIHNICNKIYNGAIPEHERRNTLEYDSEPNNHLYSFLRRYKGQGASQDAKGILEHISFIRLRGVNLKNYKQQYNYVPYSECRMYSFEEVVHMVFKEYEAWKKRNRKRDYNDMLIDALNILESNKHKDYVIKLKNSVKYLLVDEVQDTNIIAHKIIDHLVEKNGNFMSVGDTRQAIFSFQSADVTNSIDSIKRHNADVIDLNTNYRSSKTIVDNANKFIRGAKYVFGSEAITPNDLGPDISYFTSPDEQEEAYAVFDLIQELVTSGQYKYKDIAVLYRLHSQAVPLEDLFLANDTPYISYTETLFFDRLEIKDVLTYMKIALDSDSANMKSFQRIINKPLRYIRNDSLSTLNNYAKKNKISLFEAIHACGSVGIDPKQITPYTLLYNDIMRIKKLIGVKKPKEICQFILSDIGYEKWSEDTMKQRNSESDITMNFGAILSFVSQFKNLNEVFDTIEIFEKKKKEKKNENGDYLKIMTQHASKGREFPVVIILGNCSKLYPFHRNKDVQEERRLMYVAITRPEKKLYLSVIDGNLGRGIVQPSVFMKMMNFKYNGGKSNDLKH